MLRDFTWPTGLAEFGRYNLIYGWNGSGKTTISRLFRDLELGRRPASGHVTLRVDDRDISQDEFPTAHVPVRVFNRDFVYDSIFRAGGGEVPPILVVGSENVAKQKEVERLKAERAEKTAAHQALQVEHRFALSDFDRYCIDQARIIKEILRVAGPGRYNNYDKREYQVRTQQMVLDGNGASFELSEADREVLLLQHRATPKPRLTELSYSIPSLPQIYETVKELLATTVVSAAIATLKDDAALSDWVRHGFGLHKARANETCLFCEQPLPADRMTKLEDHFNAEFDRFLHRLDEQVEALKSLSRNATSLILPEPIAVLDDLANTYGTNRARVQDALGGITTCLEELVKAIEEKKARPFQSMIIEVEFPEIDDGVITEFNGVIRDHNLGCDTLAERATIARDRVADGNVARSLEEYSRLNDLVKEKHDLISPLEGEIARLSDQINSLEREIIEYLQPAEELNIDLQKYLGHDELKLSVRDTGYEVTRNGLPASTTLSEGETTAISLLYFLKSLQDRRFDLNNGIVVLDDPVSSLDSNSLFFAFSFIQNRTKNAGQLFLFTHNFSFFRQAKDWLILLNKYSGGRFPARFFMLDRVRTATVRQSELCALDPLLEKYESEYHYLFACIYREAHSRTSGTLESNYCYPNMGRRLLEMFLAFRLPNESGNLWKQLQCISFDEAKRLRIYRFIQTHSHGVAIGEPEHDPSLLSETRSVLNDIIGLIKAEDVGHHDAMVSLLVHSGTGEDTYGTP